MTKINRNREGKTWGKNNLKKKLTCSSARSQSTPTTFCLVTVFKVGSKELNWTEMKWASKQGRIVLPSRARQQGSNDTTKQLLSWAETNCGTETSSVSLSRCRSHLKKISILACCTRREFNLNIAYRLMQHMQVTTESLMLPKYDFVETVTQV